MCRATKEHLGCRDPRKIRVSEGTRYPKTLDDQCLQMSGQASTYLRLYAALSIGLNAVQPWR
jgi:hypothetical protein